MAENTAVSPQGDLLVLGAQMADDFMEKYGKRRFTSHTAPKAVLYAFLYGCYLQGEKKPITPLYPDIDSIQKKVKTYEDMDSWNGYLNLVEWQRSAFNTAVFMRNALQSNLANYDNIVRSLIAAEGLRAELRKGDLSEGATLWLSSLTIEAYTPQSHGEVITGLRKNAEAGLRYMKAYNSFMELIAEELKVPEYTIQKVLMLDVRDSLEALNEALSVLRESVERHRPEEAAGKAYGDMTRWTPEYFRETMKLYEPVGDNLPPIPEENVQEARRSIKEGVKKGLYSWYRAFFRYSTKYWRVDVYG